ncbi:hypothetical protein HW132_13630 [Brasilonema sp. CT11]|nr:hypothetical protein [Brasilonema sp. CT11]
MIAKQFAIAILIDLPYGHHWRIPTALYMCLAYGGVYVLRTRTRRTQRKHSRVAKGG